MNRIVVKISCTIVGAWGNVNRRCLGAPALTLVRCWRQSRLMRLRCATSGCRNPAGWSCC
jgi:hypothetical protein